MWVGFEPRDLEDSKATVTTTEHKTIMAPKFVEDDCKWARGMLFASIFKCIVARFFLLQHFKNRKKLIQQKHIIYQIAIKTNWFHSKIKPKLRFWVCKYVYHLATLFKCLGLSKECD
jgi:hypothetical protein